MNFNEILTQLNETMLPMNYSLKDWKKSGNKPSDYNEKNPGSKWKIVHCSKVGHIGEPLPGATNLSYEDALKRHQAIVINKG